MLNKYSKTIARIAIGLFGLSALVNVLHITGVIGRGWVNIGLSVALLTNTLVILNARKHESGKKAGGITAGLLIGFMLVWGATYVLAMIG